MAAPCGPPAEAALDAHRTPLREVFHYEELIVIGTVSQPVEIKFQAGRSHEHMDHAIVPGGGREAVAQFVKFCGSQHQICGVQSVDKARESALANGQSAENARHDVR